MTYIIVETYKTMTCHLFKTKSLFSIMATQISKTQVFFYGSYILIEYTTTNIPIRLLSSLLLDLQYQKLPISLLTTT